MTQKEGILVNQLLTQVDGVIVSDMDGEKVMLNIQKGKYFNLGEIGGQIWDYMKFPITVSEIVSKLMEEYDVSKVECVEQVISFLEILNKEELILYENGIKS